MQLPRHASSTISLDPESDQGKGLEGRDTYGASVQEGIFEVTVPIQQLFPQESRILKVSI